MHLRLLAITLVEIKFARKSMQVFHRLDTQPNSHRKFNLPLLASPFDQGFRETFFNFAKPFLKGSKVINVGEDVTDDGTFLR